MIVLGRGLALLAIALALQVSVACELNPASLPVFGARCTSSDDCAQGYACFRADPDDDEGICADEDSVGGQPVEGEGEGDDGEGEGEGGDDCVPACTGNLLCVDGACRTPCSADDACSSLACCGGVCRPKEECETCTAVTGNDCPAEQSCVFDDALNAGLCVDQDPTPSADFESCLAGTIVGNVCEEGSQCLGFSGVGNVCIEGCFDSSDCDVGRVCDVDDGEVFGRCFRSCDPLAPTSCVGELTSCFPTGVGCAGTCRQANNDARGANCAGDNLCGVNLLCIVGRCRGQCDATGQGLACEPDEVCLPASTACPEQGFCAPSCNLEDGSACDAGDSCLEFDGCDGFCFPPGDVAAGESCEFLGECALGLHCVGTPGFCREACVPGGAPCSSGTCQPFADCPTTGACVP